MIRECDRCSQSWDDAEHHNNICPSCEEIFKNMERIYCPICKKNTYVTLTRYDSVICRECSGIFSFFFIKIVGKETTRKLEVL